MWTSHFAPAFLIKPYTQSAPLWVLALAGCLPDLTWLILVVLGIEKAKYTESHVGCFPYDAVFPYSHSLLGELVLGLIVASAFSAYKGFHARGFAGIMTAALSHFVLDVAVHRKDMTLTPWSTKAYGTDMFDHPIWLFLVDYGLTFFSIIFYALHNLPSLPAIEVTQPASEKVESVKLTAKSDPAYKVIGAFLAIFLVMQLSFNFMDPPTKHARFVHAPLFATQILGVVFGTWKVEGYFMERSRAVKVHLDDGKPAITETATGAKLL